MKVYIFFQNISNFSKTFSKKMALNFTLQVNIPLLVHTTGHIGRYLQQTFVAELENSTGFSVTV